MHYFHENVTFWDLPYLSAKDFKILFRNNIGACVRLYHHIQKIKEESEINNTNFYTEIINRINYHKTKQDFDRFNELMKIIDMKEHFDRSLDCNVTYFDLPYLSMVDLGKILPNIIGPRIRLFHSVKNIKKRINSNDY